MEDQVQFKSYTFWTGDDNAEVHRFGIEKSFVTSFSYLCDKLQDIYPGIENKVYTVTWKDEEGDDVIISSNDELSIAVAAMHGGLVKLYIYCSEKELKDDENVCDNPENRENQENPESTTGNNIFHVGVLCDGCNAQVVGFRYKCISCYDFDLCSRCEMANMHPDHFMLRVPMAVMPHATIKAAIRRSRHFLKSVAISIAEDRATRKHKRDKGEKRHHGSHHQGSRHARHFTPYHYGPRVGVSPTRSSPYPYPEQQPDSPSGPHPAPQAGGSHTVPSPSSGSNRHGGRRRPHSSWFETFITYMNEFANLAGDFDFEDPKLNTEEKTRSQEQSNVAGNASNESKQRDQEQTQQGNSHTNTNQQKPCPLFNFAEENRENFEKLMEMCMNGNWKAFMPQPSTSANVNGTTSANTNNKTVSANVDETLSTNNEAPTNETPTNETPNNETPTNETLTNETPSNEHLNNEDVEMNRENDKASEADKESVASVSSVTSSISKRDASSEKGDDWTVINKEKDLMDTYVTPSAPFDHSNVIGFNLPEEFRERARISEGRLYPPLNTATAVLDPKEQERQSIPQQPTPTPAPVQQPSNLSQQSSPSAQAQKMPPRPTLTTSMPQSQRRQHHPKPHIDIAIQQMLAMGFTNDGGWLTQLLESKDGNIAAVLDLLTPVNPRN